MKLWEQITSNLAFVGVSILIIAALALLARLAEHFLPGKRKISPARRVSIIGICAAIAAVLHMLDFPLPFLAPGFYKLDFSELPVMLCGFYVGPSAAVACEAVKIILKLLFKSTSTALVGDLANFVVGCSLVLPATIFYRANKSKHGAVIGLVIGTACMTVFGSAFNAIYLLVKDLPAGDTESVTFSIVSNVAVAWTVTRQITQAEMETYWETPDLMGGKSPQGFFSDVLGQPGVTLAYLEENKYTEELWQYRTALKRYLYDQDTDVIHRYYRNFLTGEERECSGCYTWEAGVVSVVYPDGTRRPVEENSNGFLWWLDSYYQKK